MIVKIKLKNDITDFEIKMIKTKLFSLFDSFKYNEDLLLYVCFINIKENIIEGYKELIQEKLKFYLQRIDSFNYLGGKTDV